MGSVSFTPRRRARIRRRRPPARWLAAAALAVMAGAVTAHVVGDAEATRQAYATRRSVPVVVRDLAPGATITSSDVEFRDRPALAVPDGVAAEPMGRVVRDRLLAGEVVVEARLAGSGSGPGALLSPGRRALALPRDEVRVQLTIGDRVDVLAPDALGPAGGSATARRVARAAEVLAVDDTTLTVGVQSVEAPAVARAVLDGAVAVALVAPAP